MNLSLTLWRGESRVITLTVTDPDTGLPADLSSGKWQVAGVEWQMKPSVGEPDPPSVAKSLGVGISLRAQTGDTTGMLDIAIDPPDTSTLAIGNYSHDCFATFTSGARVLLIRPSGVTVLDVVNQL